MNVFKTKVSSEWLYINDDVMMMMAMTMMKPERFDQHEMIANNWLASLWVALIPQVISFRMTANTNVRCDGQPITLDGFAQMSLTEMGHVGWTSSATFIFALNVSVTACDWSNWRDNTVIMVVGQDEMVGLFKIAIKRSLTERHLNRNDCGVVNTTWRLSSIA